MLTQKNIDEADGRGFPAKDRPIQTMNPAPGNGWGCISSVDLVRMMWKLSEAQGKPVKVIDRTVRVVTRAGVFVMASLAVLVAIHVVVWWVKP